MGGIFPLGGERNFFQCLLFACEKENEEDDEIIKQNSESAMSFKPEFLNGIFILSSNPLHAKTKNEKQKK